MIEDLIKKYGVEYLMKTPLGAGFEKAMDAYNKIMENATALANNEDSSTLLKQKMGTVMLFAVMSKLKQGVLPKNYSKEDWTDIASAISEFAIMMDGEAYTKFVFTKYAEYIDASVEMYIGMGVFSEETASVIKALSDEIYSKTEQFDSGDITEVSYVEDCLWISLEAMVRMLSATIGVVGGQEGVEFAQALATFCFEYGRCRMYSHELAEINNLLEEQEALDVELQKKYDAYLDEITEYANMMDDVISNAFSVDFRSSLNSSVIFAKVAGVNEDEVLETLDDVDDFFLS